jgi:sugar phosphate permease
MLTRVEEGEASIVEASRTPQPMSRREWTIVLLLMISVIINYIDRSNLSLAAPLIRQQFALSPLQIGSLLSAFFWSYALIGSRTAFRWAG